MRQQDVGLYFLLVAAANIIIIIKLISSSINIITISYMNELKEYIDMLWTGGNDPCGINVYKDIKRLSHCGLNKKAEVLMV